MPGHSNSASGEVLGTMGPTGREESPEPLQKNEPQKRHGACGTVTMRYDVRGSSLRAHRPQLSGTTSNKNGSQDKRVIYLAPNLRSDESDTTGNGERSLTRQFPFGALLLRSATRYLLHDVFRQCKDFPLGCSGTEETLKTGLALRSA